MDKRMPKKKVDELATVKAAAWAWYLHGSGYEGKPTRESDPIRARRTSKPSRYKLEAMKNDHESSWSPTSSSSSDSSILVLSPTHTDMSLLDSYEIRRIGRQLASILESSSVHGDLGQHQQGSRYHRRGASMVKKKMDEIFDGFWLRHARGLCSARGMVVDPVAVDRRPQRKKETVISSNNCRPKSKTG